MKRTHLVLVELSLWALSANPMHQLAAAKGGLVEINAICSIAQVVPFRQQMLLRCFKCWLTCSRSPCLSFTILGKTTVTRGTLRNLTSPLVAACWPLPLSPNQPPSGCLRMFAGFLAVTICYSAFCIHAEPCISLVQACIAIGSVSQSRSATDLVKPAYAGSAHRSSSSCITTRENLSQQVPWQMRVFDCL